MSDDLTFSSGSSRKVRLRDAERQLNELWEAAGGEARSQGQDGVMRLRELNLIIYAAGERMADHVSEVIPRLSQRHPARAIVLLELEEGDVVTAGDPALATTPGTAGPPQPSVPATPGLEAWVTAACYQMREGGRHVCWEQVTVPARGAAVPLLRNAAAGLLVPDLPTVLWWPGEPDFEGPTLRRLGEMCDLFIVDSAGLPDPVAGLAGLARLVYDGSRNFGLGDLNWSRLGPWRDMTAEFFDDPSRRPWLSRIGRVSITYGSEDPYGRSDCLVGPAAARALLYAGWLTGRLGWVPDRSGWESRGDAVHCMLYARNPTETRDGATGAEAISLDLRCSPDACGPMAGLASVSLEVRPGGDKEANRVLDLALSPGSCIGTGHIREGEADQLTRTYDLTPVPEDRLLADEIDFLSPDTVYEEAVLHAATLAALPGSSLLREGSHAR